MKGLAAGAGWWGECGGAAGGGHLQPQKQPRHQGDQLLPLRPSHRYRTDKERKKERKKAGIGVIPHFNLTRNELNHFSESFFSLFFSRSQVLLISAWTVTSLRTKFWIMQQARFELIVINMDCCVHAEIRFRYLQNRYRYKLFISVCWEIFSLLRSFLFLNNCFALCRCAQPSYFICNEFRSRWLSAFKISHKTWTNHYKIKKCFIPCIWQDEIFELFCVIHGHVPVPTLIMKRFDSLTSKLIMA